MEYKLLGCDGDTSILHLNGDQAFEQARLERVYFGEFASQIAYVMALDVRFDIQITWYGV